MTRRPALALLESGPQPPEPPQHEVVSGPSFPITIKVLATVLVAALIVYGWMALGGPPAERAGALGASDWGFLVAVTAVIGSGYRVILTGRTCFDGEAIEQSGLWRRTVKLADIRQVKLIHLPGLAWLVVPRLVVRTGTGLTTFHAGDPAVLACFKRLAHGG